MAITGLVVTFGSILANSIQGVTSAPIYGPSTDSDAMTIAGTTTVSAAAPKKGFIPMVSVYAAADWFITVGKVPSDPSIASPANGRRAIPAGKTVDVFCDIGDKVRGSPA